MIYFRDNYNTIYNAYMYVTRNVLYTTKYFIDLFFLELRGVSYY